MEVNKKSKNKKIRKYAISRFNQDINESLYLGYQNSAPYQNLQFTDEDTINKVNDRFPKKMTSWQLNHDSRLRISANNEQKQAEESE